MFALCNPSITGLLQVVIENMDVHGFRRYVFSALRNETNVIIYYNVIPCRLSTDPEIYDLD